ncbi:Dipeptide and tripeptide permease A [Streptomyces griseoloalbus]
MSGYIWFFVAAAIFWMIYDQGGSTLAIFAESSPRNSVFGWDFPVSWYQSVNPVLIMALAPVFAAFWLALKKTGAARSRARDRQVQLRLVLVGASFFVCLMPLTIAGRGHKAAAMWLVAIYFIQTVAELTLSPVGLSVTTKMAPAKYASQMMQLSGSSPSPPVTAQDRSALPGRCGAERRRGGRRGGDTRRGRRYRDLHVPRQGQEAHGRGPLTPPARGSTYGEGPPHRNSPVRRDLGRWWPRLGA